MVLFEDLVYISGSDRNRDGGNDTAGLPWLLLDLSCFYFQMSLVNSVYLFSVGNSGFKSLPYILQLCSLVQRQFAF